jgi:putative hydrolase
VTDNIFDRLAELLQSTGPVNWRLASQIAESVAGAAEPVEPWVAEEYEELSRTAVMLIGRSGVLDPGTAPPPAIIDPRGWAAANVEGYAYLAEPLAEKMGTPGGGAGPAMGLEQILGQLGPALVGMQVGSLVGTLAQGLLGQFDAGLPPVADESRSYLVVPNLEALTSNEGLDVRQARLWAVLRETAHQAQFAVPWVRGHLVGLAGDYIRGLEFRPGHLQDRLQSLQDPAELERMMAEPGGLGGFEAGPESDDIRDGLLAMLALLDGHGEATVTAAAGTMLPDLGDIRRAVATRHIDGGPQQALGQMLAIEFDRSLADAAADFCDDIERRWGLESLCQLWEGPGSLPTLAELQDPVGWAARVLLSDKI